MSFAPPGLQFEQQGDELHVGVYINMEGAYLLNFQIEIDVDDDALETVSCADLEWPGVTCTINDPPNKAKLIGNDLSSSATGRDFGVDFDN